jgi:hypothetical protein
MRQRVCILLDLFIDLHRQVGPGSTPPSSWAHSSRACRLLAFSIKQLCNSAAPTLQCRHPTFCLCASSSTFNLHRQVRPGSTPPLSWCNVGLGLEWNGLPHRSAHHHMLLLIFCFSLAFVVILIASRLTQHTLQIVTQDITLPPRGSHTLPFSYLFRCSFM